MPDPTTRPRLKLLHTADCHLGLDYDPPRAERAFQAVIDLALAEGVDCLLIAGDLFDHNRVGEELVHWTAAQINRLAVPSVLLPGNHDQFDDHSVHRRHSLPDLCPNLRMLLDPWGTVLHLPGQGLTLWGRPVVDHHPDFRPLEGAPPRGSDGWHVALAHGFYLAPGESTYRSSPVRAEEIAALGWDYLALGHVHRYVDLSAGVTKACYPGSSFSMESGEAELGSAALVTLDPADGVSMRQVRFRPTATPSPAGR